MLVLVVEYPTHVKSERTGSHFYARTIFYNDAGN